MILVDTSVWIDFFADRSEPHVGALEEFLCGEEDVCICGVILMEVLQGIRADREYRKTAEYFEAIVFLPMPQPVYLRAASIYRSLRRKGITIRKPMDCLIAAVAVEHDVSLLHNDRDFEFLAEHTALKVRHPGNPAR